MSTSPGGSRGPGEPNDVKAVDLGPPDRLLEFLFSLRGVDVLRTLLKRTFGLELTLSDARGPLAHQAGGVMTGSSEVCRAALFSPTGFSRCDAFYRGLPERASKEPQPCHLGLSCIAVPIPTDRPCGLSLSVSGFSATHSSAAVPVEPARLARALTELDPTLVDAADLVRRLPNLRGDRIELVRHALDIAATEMAVALDERMRRLTQAGAGDGPFGMVGRSPRMQETFELVRRVVRSEAPVLVLGESGTGKELVARALHDQGPRRGGPFVAQSCGALEEGTLEAALFGHVKGAFSGASRSEVGLFGAASKGTLFLDEVGEMSPAMQAKLLRVLSDGTYLPVGATSPRRADVRIVCATHRDLRAMVARGEFREDLFYRLHVISIPLPPLRERPGDLALLVERFLAEVPGAPAKVSEAAWRCLERYGWPGNVRELRAEVERWGVVAAESKEVRPEHLASDIQASSGWNVPRSTKAPPDGEREPQALAAAVEALERRLLEEGLARTGGNRTRLAKELDISRTTLNERLKRFGLG